MLVDDVVPVAEFNAVRPEPPTLVPLLGIVFEGMGIATAMGKLPARGEE
jgi:hypothetical protein